MVAKTPTKHRKMVAPPLNPTLLRETVKKVDRCMARLQELQYTVSGGTKVISGVNLSPRSTRGYLRTSIRCKQETLRMKNSAARKSPVGKFQGSLGGEWQRMSLPAMLVGETVGEILQASQFAREVVEAVASKTKRTVCDDPKTPVSKRRSPNSKVHYENTELKARRKREKQVVLQLIRSESSPPSLQRARSRINFKVSPKKRDIGKENWFVANRVSPKNKPWAKKTVLFPNPLFLSSPSTQQHKVSKTRSPVITKTLQTTPHKFLIKSPPSTRSPVTKTRQTTPHKFLIKSPPSNSKFQVMIKNAPVSLSPTRPASLNKRSPPSNSKFQVKIKNAPVSLSPTRPANLNKRSPKKSPPKKMSTASKLRRSFSPSRLANRFVSPLKSRMSTQQKSGSFMSGLKQRPSSPMRFSGWKL